MEDRINATITMKMEVPIGTPIKDVPWLIKDYLSKQTNLFPFYNVGFRMKKKQIVQRVEPIDENEYIVYKK